MLRKLKLMDKQYKEMRPKFLTMQKKCEQMQRSRKQVDKEVVEYKERALSLQSQLQQCQKVFYTQPSSIHLLVYHIHSTDLYVHTLTQANKELQLQNQTNKKVM